jgi:hypothetical protein
MLARLPDPLKYAALSIVLVSLIVLLVTYYKHVAIATPPPSLASLGMGDTPPWHRFQAENAWDHQQVMNPWGPVTVKAVFMHQDSPSKASPRFLVSLKRKKTHGSHYKRSLLWEFFGGRVQDTEDTLEALRRELTEEDPSLVLSNALFLSMHGDRPLWYRLYQLQNEERGVLVRMFLTPDEARALEEFYAHLPAGKGPRGERMESMGRAWLPQEFLQLDESLKKQWTPKSVRILKAIQLWKQP